MVLSVLLLGLAHAQDVETVRLQHALPDPHLAFSLSLTLGFGAGHFYAERPTLGTAFLASQVVGAGLIGLAFPVSQENPGAANTMLLTGIAVTGCSRFAEAWLAPYSARKTGLEKLEQAASGGLSGYTPEPSLLALPGR